MNYIFFGNINDKGGNTSFCVPLPAFGPQLTNRARHTATFSYCYFSILQFLGKYILCLRMNLSINRIEAARKAYNDLNPGFVQPGCAECIGKLGY